MRPASLALSLALVVVSSAARTARADDGSITVPEGVRVAIYPAAPPEETAGLDAWDATASRIEVAGQQAIKATDWLRVAVEPDSLAAVAGAADLLARADGLKLDGLADADLAKVAKWKLPRLAAIEVVDGKLGDEGIAQLKAFPQTKRLEVSRCPTVQFGVDDLIKALPQLTHLRVVDCEKGGNLENVKSCPQLRVLALRYCPFVDSSAFAPMSKLAELRELDVASSGLSMIEDFALEHLAGLTKLRVLNLHWCERITQVGTVHLAGLKELRSLDLGACNKINDKALEPLAKLTELETLNLEHLDHVTPAGLAAIAGLKKLVKLDLSYCSAAKTDAATVHLAGLTGLRTLVLTGSDMTGTGLSQLKALDGLAELELTGCSKLMDAAFEHLKALKGLKRLELKIAGEKITDAAVEAFQKARPEVDVQFGR